MIFTKKGMKGDGAGRYAMENTDEHLDPFLITSRLYKKHQNTNFLDHTTPRSYYLLSQLELGRTFY